MKHLTIKLNSHSISHAVDTLKAYQKSIGQKTATFVERLLDAGIKEAESNSGDYGGYIIYEKEIEGTTHCVGLLIARDKQKIIREWNYHDYGIKSTAISPILFAEFGSGWLAEVLFPVSGVGQGTYPGQEHAFDPGGWSWKTEDGKWHHSKGEKPTHPMYQAGMKIIDEILSIANEVFINDI